MCIRDRDNTAGAQLLNGAAEQFDVSTINDAATLVKLMDEMQKNMREAAKNLKFEEAMVLRDRIRECDKRLREME